jgi:SynChlorMet cassette protein ScmD
MHEKPVANPLIVFREEFDDWGILFDPDSGTGFGLNPTGIFIWKRLDGSHTVEDLVADVLDDWLDVPDDAEALIREFLSALTEHGLAGHEIATES